MVAIVAWVQAICACPTQDPTAVAAALGFDPGVGARLGSQLVLPPPEGVDYFELGLDPETDLVEFIEAILAEPIALDELSPMFGRARPAPPGPHDSGPTVVFDTWRPAGAPRGCTIVAQMRPPTESPGMVSVTLLLRPVHDR